MLNAPLSVQNTDLHWDLKVKTKHEYDKTEAIQFFDNAVMETKEDKTLQVNLHMECNTTAYKETQLEY